MSKSKVKTRPWDAAEHLKTEKDTAVYLQAVADDCGDDPQIIASALGDIARARGMMQVARDTGLARESLYRALAPGGNPSFATVMKVAKAMGLRLQVGAA